MISVAICTYNRAALLRQTLQSLRSVRVPGEWELLVVDNRSTDDTPRVLETFGGMLPLRAIREEKQGIAHARNAAARAARGAHVIYTDDDMQFAETWLSSYADAFGSTPETGFFGGPIEPWFEAPPPEWLLRALPSVTFAYGKLDYDEPAILHEQTFPFGGNFAVRADLLKRYLFDTSLGVRGSERNVGEETDLFRRLTADGHTGRSVPDAIVRHFVPRDKMSMSHLRRFYVAQGQFIRRQSSPWNGPVLFGKPRYLWRAAIEAECRHVFARLLGDRAGSVPHLVDASHAWGMLGMRAQRK